MYQMAAYCRLSKEDAEDGVSESIENQIKLIREYVRRTDDLNLADIYIDDGCSGLYFENRPEFQRMMRDIYDGRIGGVITKDISRLGREHIETSNYIERVFPSLGIRYIAILDGVDSVSGRNEELARFKTLFNDMYSRDISRKIRGALSVQKRRGQFVSGFAPYGYVKDPDDRHRFLVDEEAAEVVRQIFHLYQEGYSKNGIARKLNQEKILAPSEYKRKVLGLKYVNALEKAETKGWSYSTVNMILKNRVYTGAMVQHKSEKISYKIKKYRYIPEDQQYIVEEMHEPVISMEQFERVRTLMKNRTRLPGGLVENVNANPYAGLLICGDCGAIMQKVTARNGYDCGTYHRKGNALCFCHFIKKETLDSVMFHELRRQLKCAAQAGRNEIFEVEYIRTGSKKRRGEEEKKIERLNRELTAVQKYNMKTYENYMDGILSKKEYLTYKAEYEKEERDVREKILLAERRINSLEKEAEVFEQWIERFAGGASPPEITRGILTELIDTITVNGNKSIDLAFRYRFPGE